MILDIKEQKMKKIFVSFLFFLSFGQNVFAGDSLCEKIITTSNEFLGKPYSLGPLGEGRGIDTDPLYRFDKFDCLTFVETVLAKTFSSENNFPEIMNDIRYKDGYVSFETRNHFQNPDWVNNNAKYVKNISNEISKFILNKDAKQSVINLDKKSWFKKNYDIDVDVKPQTVTLDYITLSDFKNNIEKFTSFVNKPYIFMTVISDKTLPQKVGTEIDVSHTGFLIKKNGVLYLRHASSIAGKVVDNNFEKYIERMQKNPKYMGFSLIETCN